MDWSWSFISTVAPDVGAASGFYADALGLHQLGGVELSSIGAEGQLFALGTNVALAVVAPVESGPAQQLLDSHRGGLCHLGIEVSELPDAGVPTASSLGEGRLVSLAEPLGIEFLGAGAAPVGAAGSSPADGGEGAGVVVELDHVATVVPDLEAAAERLRHLGLHEDSQTSRWDFPQLMTRNAVFPGRSGYLEINQAFTDQGVFGSLAAARGAGIVGLTLTVEDMDAAVDHLRGAGVGVSDPGPVLARTPAGEERDLGQSAVISMKQSFGTRLFLFAPSAAAPHYDHSFGAAR